LAKPKQRKVTFAKLDENSTDEELDAFLDALGLPAEEEEAEGKKREDDARKTT
jgi:hypothetical protein